VLDGWLLLQTKPNREMAATAVLRRSGFKVYLPQVRVRQTHRGQVQYVEKPFLSRYIFAVVDWNVGLTIFRSFPSSVNGVVRWGDNPLVVPHAVVEQIRDRELHGFIQLDPPPPPPDKFRKGQAVRVTNGAYSGLVGVFCKQTGTERASVFLNMFGRETLTHMRIDGLEGL